MEEWRALQRRIEQLEKDVALLKAERSSEPTGELKKELIQSEPLEKAAISYQQPTPMKDLEKQRPLVEQERNVGEPVASALPHAKKKVQEPIDFERALSKWLPRMFMFILLLGILWGLKVASEYGLFTDALRIVGGYGATVGLYFLGMKYVRQGQAVFGGTLLSGVIAIGIFTTFAGHYLYGYLPSLLALAIGVGYVVFGVWLSSRTKIEVLTLFSAIAGFLLPYLLENTAGHSLVLYGYLLLLFMSLLYVSSKEHHRYTFYITYSLFHFSVFFNMLLNIGDNHRWLIVVTILLQHIGVLFFYLMRKIPRQIFTETLIYTNFLFALGWMQLLTQTEQGWMYGSFALVYTGLAYYAFKRGSQELKSVLLAISVIAIATFVVVLRPEDERWTILLLLLTGTASIWVALTMNTLRTLVSGGIVYASSALTVMGSFSIPTVVSIEHLAWFVLLASIGLLFYTLYKSPAQWLQGRLDQIDRSLIAGQLVVLLYVTRLVHLMIQQNVFLLYSEVVSRHLYFLVWIVVLVAMYQFYQWQHGKYIVQSACIIYLGLGILILFSSIDRLSYDYLTQSVPFAFLVQLLYVGILAYALRLVARKRFSWASDQLVQSLPTLGFAFQIIAFVFVNKWYMSLAVYADLHREFYYLLHTAILLIFTFVSISIGRKQSWKAVKYGGVFLLFISIIKLFFIDLFAVSILIRALLFIGVGIGGLLYSKTLLKEQPKQENDDRGEEG